MTTATTAIITTAHPATDNTTATAGTTTTHATSAIVRKWNSCVQLIYER